MKLSLTPTCGGPLLVAGLLLGLALGACTAAELEREVEIDIPIHDNKLQLTGKFCTTDPADVVFPLKVLFIIDTSQSMNVSDPVSTTEMDPTKQTGRAKAIRDVIAQFVDLKAKFLPRYCHTGKTGCNKGSTNCADCKDAKQPKMKFICIGPDCCNSSPAKCNGVPICNPSIPKGTCAALCDVSKAGCKPGEKSCPDCPETGECTGGICGRHRDPGVEFAIMRFGSAKQVLTRDRSGLQGFTNNIKELVTAIPQVSNAGSVTDYEGALTMAYKVIDADIKNMSDSNAGAISRTKYVVIFLSDGKPYPAINDEDDWDTVPCYIQGALLGVPLKDPENCKNDPVLANMRKSIQEYNIPSRVLRRVGEIMSLKTYWKIGDIRLHTSYLAGAEPSSVEDQSIYLLKQMAQVGKGAFRNFPNGESINFLHVGFSSLRRVFELKNFIATNINARPHAGTIIADSDGDGLNDQTEVEVGSSRNSGDTDGDGFSDTLEHFYRASGWDALDPSDADCPLLTDSDGDKRPDDSDSDELLDCEERFLGTSRSLFDSDADGIPDSIEVRFGTNPVVADTESDLDFDGMPNGDEIRLHTDPRADDAAHRSRANYRYDIKKTGTGIETVGLTCVLDADCPATMRCAERYCRCTADSDCSSNSKCSKDADCTVAGEGCVTAKCKGKWTCRPPLADLKQSEGVCATQKYITCYTYKVENIALLTPRADPLKSAEDGWNKIYLYFAEAPFDNPTEYGNFQKACVKAWYDNSTGAKRPATGRLMVPQTAWLNPRQFNKTYLTTSNDSSGGKMACGAAVAKAVYCNPGDACIDPLSHRCRVSACICPDGKAGLCSKP